MAEAVAAVHEILPDFSAIAVCCAAEDKWWGITEEVLPNIVNLLGEAKAVAFLRCVHAEADEGKIKRVFHQLWDVGKKAYELARGKKA